MEQETKTDMDYMVTILIIVGMIIANIYIMDKNIKLKHSIDAYRFSEQLNKRQ